MATGAELKELGIGRALANRRAAAWRADAHLVLLGLIRECHRGLRSSLTSEDVTARVGQPPTPNQVGAVINAAARMGLIVPVGMVNARRPNQHAAKLTRWVPAGRAIADLEAEEELTLW